MAQGLEIVVIDDDGPARGLTALVLRREFPDARVIEISKPLELAEYLADGDCDVAVVDPDTRWGEGSRLLLSLRNRFPDALLILVGQSAGQTYGAQAVTLEIDGYLGKDAAGLLDLGPTIRAARMRQRRNRVAPVAASGQTTAEPQNTELLDTLAESVRQLQQQVQNLGQDLVALARQQADALGAVKSDLGRLSGAVGEPRIAPESAVSEAVPQGDGDPVARQDRAADTGNRPESAPSQPLQPLGEVVAKARAALPGELIEGARIVSGGLPPLLVPGKPLSEVFSVLLDNALRHRGAETPEIVITAAMTDAGWRIEVTDNGAGIEPDRLATLLQSPPQGSGLSRAAQILEGLGISLQGSSIPGVGSSFWFQLPADAVDMMANSAG